MMDTHKCFSRRHLGSGREEVTRMLAELNYASMECLMEAAVPADIRLDRPLDLPEALDEASALRRLREIMSRNKVRKSYIGQGYHGTHVPGVIQRNILENPGWYTAYTPYQAEISQGRLEALLNFQTMIVDLTGLEVSNASLLDEGTAAAEAMSMALSSMPKGEVMFVADSCHPQTIDVVRTRAEPLGIRILCGDWRELDPAAVDGLFAVLVQYPDTFGEIGDFTELFRRVHAVGGTTIVAADLLALTLLRAPGEFGADICVGTTQRFGVPMGFGGPHAGYMSCTDAFKRKIPGRLIGVSHDTKGRPGFRLALQTREQHIRRDKATSNICTAQVLLAVMASMYAVYHGPQGLRAIATEVAQKAGALASLLRAGGRQIVNRRVFDTVTVTAVKAREILEQARQAGINLRELDQDSVGISCDETSEVEDLVNILGFFGVKVDQQAFRAEMAKIGDKVEGAPGRESDFLTQRVFNSYHTETEMLRYLSRLEKKDLALNESMIPLGSCTMKLNATSEMIPLSWPETGQLHPFAPAEQSEGYRLMLGELEEWLGEITGLPATSLQPNAGSQGEYAGLLAIRHYHNAHGGQDRNLCLIPASAHGTNPASAVMAGMKVVAVACDEHGNIDVEDLQRKIDANPDRVAALMITYPSTHGVFESTVRDICRRVHACGGQVYMDGANMNAQVGLTSPGKVGADVCHLNLHKTFSIPHGGGGPGVGPICVARHLQPYLPGHAELSKSQGAVASAPWGSASVDVISWMYIAMMGAKGLTEASQLAILNANYIAHRLSKHYPVLYTGERGLVAHECIIDVRPLTAQSGITVEDVAKRLMDYNYHAPTMSWPVPGTLMIEPTESESMAELDRFCDAMIAIHGEIMAVADGVADANDNVLKNAPHPAEDIIADNWTHPYGREQAAYPLPWLRAHKFWPAVSRIDNVAGDRHLVCTCDSVEAYASEGA